MFNLQEYILTDCSYPILFMLTIGYFAILYFGLSFLFVFLCNLLRSYNLLHKITEAQASTQQVKSEILHSLKSIVVFGFSSLPLIYCIRMGVITLMPNNFFTVIGGLLILTIWNEVHFFTIHRMMHNRFLMKHVHYIHHQSKVPTVFSIYSFHWFEAFLLSTVPITIAPFIALSPVAIALYPISSIILNLAGHCNHRFGNGNGESWVYFATHHHQHHHKGRKNYGFAFNFLDKLFHP